MRLSMFAVVVVAATALAACGGGGSKKPADAGADAAKPIDAANVVNALGQLCPFATGGAGTPCPAGNACVKVNGVGTNANTGFCTPNCMNMSSICVTGYTGPAGGTPQCALKSMNATAPDGCAIACTTMANCPTGMSCDPVPNSTAKICVPT